MKALSRSGLRFIWIAILMLAIDRFSKYWILQHLLFLEPIHLLPILDLNLAFNTGAAFSFLHNASGWQQWFLGGLAITVSLVVIVWLTRLPASERWVSVALNLVLAGALGNAWDRALYGYVIDFISFHLNGWHFAIFNIADSAICVGAFMLFWHWWQQAKCEVK